jgi:hypothetical protein
MARSAEFGLAASAFHVLYDRQALALSEANSTGIDRMESD